jgi:hypothetical protein
MQTSGCRATLMPALFADAFPPFAFRTTTSGKVPRGVHGQDVAARGDVVGHDPRDLDELEVRPQGLERAVA